MSLHECSGRINDIMNGLSEDSMLISRNLCILIPDRRNSYVVSDTYTQIHPYTRFRQYYNICSSFPNLYLWMMTWRELLEKVKLGLKAVDWKKVQVCGCVCKRSMSDRIN